jgi:hypothetical protein
VPPNPDWDIEKDGVPVCYEEGTENVYIDIDYTIEVINEAEGGDLEYVRDEYDPRIERDWILSTEPQATQITDEYIQWDIPEGDRTFEEGESREFKYTIRIPLFTNQDVIGEQFNNHAVAHFTLGDEVHAYKDLLIGCNLPPTGLFDSAVARIALGGILLMLGFGFYKMGFMDNSVNWLLSSTGNLGKRIKYQFTEEKKMNDWEDKALKDLTRKKED